MAVDRMEICEDVGELARELGVRPRCLYKWRKKLEMVEAGQVRIPDDADQRSGLMPITHSERCRSVIPGDADHSFRGDPDQFDQDRRKIDHDARKGDRDPHFPTASTTTSLTIPITFWKIHPPASLRSDH